MPKRTNLFQQVVAIIQEHLAGDAHVTESEELVNRLTGDRREVDVVIRSVVAGHAVIVSVEAVGRGRRATVEWVEQMIAKHQNLPTNKLVLVAEKGFTDQAKQLAEAENATALTPEDVSEHELAATVIGGLRSLWPKTIESRPEEVLVFVRRPDGELKFFPAMSDNLVFLDDGSDVGQLLEVVEGFTRWHTPRLLEMPEVAGADTSRCTRYVLEIGPPTTVNVAGVEHGLAVRWEESDPPELHPIERIRVAGQLVIEVSDAEVALTHRRLGEVVYAFGETVIGAKRGVVLLTEGEHGTKVSLRLQGSS